MSSCNLLLAALADPSAATAITLHAGRDRAEHGMLHNLQVRRAEVQDVRSCIVGGRSCGVIVAHLPESRGDMKVSTTPCYTYLRCTCFACETTVQWRLVMQGSAYVKWAERMQAAEAAPDGPERILSVSKLLLSLCVDILRVSTVFTDRPCSTLERHKLQRCDLGEHSISGTKESSWRHASISLCVACRPFWLPATAQCARDC